MVNIEDLKIYNISSQEFYKYCTEDLKSLKIPFFILYVKDCSCSRQEITTDDFLEWMEYLSPSNGYFFLGLSKDNLNILNFFKKLFNLSDFQVLNVKNSCFEGDIYFYEGKPLCFSTSQFSTNLGVVDLLAIPEQRIQRDFNQEISFAKKINIENIKLALGAY